MPGNTLDGFTSAFRMLEALHSARISAEELLDLHLRRIDRFNPVINAIVTVDVEGAREAARAADLARRSGEDRPLLGLPITIKDTIDVRGLLGTAGVEETRGRRPAADARVVARLRAAGAVIMGKTNVPPWASDWQASNPLFGRTNNPWDLDRTPGGSTGGGAAALAAGLTPLEVGSDIAGLIRVPAMFCGVYGHRPSDSAVPGSGHFPGNPLPSPARRLGVQGPLARSAEDLDLALDVIAGPDVGEDAAWRLMLPAPRHQRLEDFRVAILPTIPWAPIDDSIATGIERLADALTRIGARVDRTMPDMLGDLRDHHALYLPLFAQLTGGGAPEPVRRMREVDEHIGEVSFDAAFHRGLEASASEYLEWQSRRQEYRAAWRSFFRDWDVLVAPIFGRPAFPHTEAPWPERWHEIGGKRVAYTSQHVWPALATVAGQPATACPMGRSGGGLPIGLQAIGPYLEDRTPIRFAALVADELGGFAPPPGFHDLGAKDTDPGTSLST